MSKKILAAVLVIVQLILLLPNIIGMAVSNDINLYQGISGKIPFESLDLPLGTPEFNVAGLKINTEVWKDKHLLVYGDYTMANPRGIDVKFYHDVEDGETEPPFYFRDIDGNGCEYRYLGFTKENNKAPNPNFPEDKKSDCPDEAKSWFYHPWDLGTSYISSPGTANDAIIIGGKDAEKAIEYIDASIDWRIKRGINAYTGKRMDAKLVSETPTYHFFNVDSPPTTKYSGRGRMFSRDMNGVIWYTTYSIPNVQSKNPTEVTAKCTILNKDELYYGEGESTKIVQVEVTGLLNDQHCYDKKYDEVTQTEGSIYDDFERSIYYNREDIKDWSLTLNTPGGGSYEIVQKSNNGMNGSKYIFEVELDREFVENGNAEFHAYVYCNYITADKSNTAQAMDSTSIVAREAVKSLFTVNEVIDIKHGGSYSSELLNYRDASIGNITNYEWKFTNNENDDIATYSYPIAINDSINNKFYEFAKSFIDNKLAAASPDVNYYFSFTIDQVVSDDKGNSSTYSKTVTINIVTDEESKAFAAANCELPDKAIDMVKYAPRDNTDTHAIKSIEVFVAGEQVDYNHFFSGDYTFSETIGLLGRNGKLTEVRVIYTSVDDIVSEWIEWVYVYSSKPYVQYNIEGTLKVNRRVDLKNTSESANPNYVFSRYPISYEWEIEAVEGENTDLRMRAGYENNVNQKTFLSKKSGVYKFTLKGNNGLRDADPYSIELPIYEDYTPAVIFNIWNSHMSRNESLFMDYEGVSLEDDIITTQSLKIVYDSDNDGVYETEIASYDDATTFDDYLPSELGKYQVIYEVHEDFGQDTLPEFITPDDKKYIIEVREFVVENLSPMTKIYVDVPLNFPETDVYFLTDPDLDLNKIGEVKSKRIDIINDLRQNSIVPEVDIWDLHTYIYDKEVSKSRRTGGSYPSSTYSYSSDGYTGTLSRDRVVDNGEYVDRGKYITVSTSKFVSVSASNNSKYTKYKYADGSWHVKGSGGSNLSSTKSYNSGGYSGTLYKNGSKTRFKGYSPSSLPSNADDGDTVKQYERWTTAYDGTVYGTKQEWQEKWVWDEDYTGYYSGTVYKPVKQSFTDIFRDTSDKYIVYIADGNVTGKTDLTMIKNRSDSKVIYSSPLSQQGDIEADFYIEYKGDVGDVLDQALEIIKSENPYDLMYTVLLNENVNVKFADVDAENDPISNYSYQVVHDPSIFDNNTGLAGFAVPSYSESNYTELAGSEINFNFTKKGKYTVYRRITDSPIGHVDQSLNSNEPKLDVLVHEKPIADFIYSKTFNESTANYDTNWEDLSYDPDFEHSRSDKGIIDRKVKFRRVGDPWSYKVPDTLTYGSYELEYVVQDVFGVWSDVKSSTFDLIPPIDLYAQLRVQNTTYTTAAVPMGENLLLYNVRTVYPRNVKLEVTLYDSEGAIVGDKQFISYSSSTGSKSGNTINWRDIVYPIPIGTLDGNYTMNLKSIEVTDETSITELNWPVVVVNPKIDLDAAIDPNPALAGERIQLTGNTEGQAQVVIVDLSSLGEATPLNLVPDFPTIANFNVFKGSFIVPINTDDGFYDIKFTATKNTVLGLITEEETLQLEVRGNVYDLIKTRIVDTR